jgi:hypothetical protein
MVTTPNCSPLKLIQLSRLESTSLLEISNLDSFIGMVSRAHGRGFFDSSA